MGCDVSVMCRHACCVICNHMTSSIHEPTHMSCMICVVAGCDVIILSYNCIEYYDETPQMSGANTPTGCYTPRKKMDRIDPKQIPRPSE